MKELKFVPVIRLDDMAKNILKKRYFMDGETKWNKLCWRVVNHVCSNWDDAGKNEVYDMIYNRYFLPNSPTLVNSGKNKHAGLSACFVLPFEDTIEEIYKTKLDFALIARKGGGCGTTLSNIRPEGDLVNGSTHGYAGGAVKFADTISHDMDAITQSGFRSMAIMFTMRVDHPDILKFISAKTEEGKIANANISVVVTDEFMKKVENNEDFWTVFNGKKYQKYNAKEIFDKIVEGAWKNGEPGLLFHDRINESPYSYSGIEIEATNPCITGDTIIHTTNGDFEIAQLCGRDVDVYCMNDFGEIAIGHARNIRRTKRNAEIVEIKTTRGILRCTPDHLIYTKNRGYVQAIRLTKNDKIVGLNKRIGDEKYIKIGLSGTGYVKEHQFIAGFYQDISGKDVHHIDDNFHNNIKNNLEVLEHGSHSKKSNNGHTDWSLRDSLTGMFLKKGVRQKKKSLPPLAYNPIGVNLRVVSVTLLDYSEDVYDMEVDGYHNFLANDIIIHNCGEQPLPPYGSCNLGSLDISKFTSKDGIFNTELFEKAVRLSVRFLDSVIEVNSYPTKEIAEVSKKSRPVGAGLMGIADFFMKKKLAYGSRESIEEFEKVSKMLYDIAKDESEKLGEEFGVPEWCSNLPEPRRNITVVTFAPTGTLSLLAGCNSGIEPFFSEITERKDKTGEYVINSPSAEEYFRCAVSTDGEKEVTWEEHVSMQAIAQKYSDSGVSKTINFPNKTHKDTIGKSFIMAWKNGCKGITIYRNGSREIEVLSPKNVEKNKCPMCGEDTVKYDGCTKCVKCDWSLCTVG